MKNYLRSLHIWLALVIPVFSGCAVMPLVEKAPDSEIGSKISGDPNTITYWLPKTQIVVKVPIKQTVYGKASLAPDPKVPADVSAYLKQVTDALGVKATDVHIFDRTQYRIDTEGLVLTSRGVRDPQAQFNASVKTRPLQTLNLTMEFSDRQVMKSVQSTVTNQAIPIVTKVISVVAAYHKISVLERREASDPVSAALNELVAIHDTRSQLLAGASPAGDAAYVQLVLADLTKREEKLVASLLGTTKETTWVAEIFVEPTSAHDAANSIASVFENRGLQLDKYSADSNLDTSPFKFGTSTKVSTWRWDGTDFQQGDRDEFATQIQLSLTQRKPIVGTTNPSLNGSTGSYVYRVPQEARAKLSISTKDSGQKSGTFVVQDMLVTQLGHLRQLPRDLPGIKGTYHLTLDPNTGALTKFTTESTVDDAAARIVSVGETIDALRNTPTEKLAKEKAYLETLKAVQDLREQLGIETGGVQ